MRLGSNSLHAEKCTGEGKTRQLLVRHTRYGFLLHYCGGFPLRKRTSNPSSTPACPGSHFPPGSAVPVPSALPSPQPRGSSAPPGGAAGAAWRWAGPGRAAEPGGAAEAAAEEEEEAAAAAEPGPARPGRPPAGEWGRTAPPPRWLRGDAGPARLYGVAVAVLGPQPAPQPRLQPPVVAGAGRGPRLPAPGTASPEVPWQSGDPAKKGPGGGCCPPPPAPALLHLPFAAGPVLLLYVSADGGQFLQEARVLGPAGGLVSRGKCDVVEK